MDKYEAVLLNDLSAFKMYVEEAHPFPIFYEKREESIFILWAGRCTWKGNLASEKEVMKLEDWLSDKKAFSGKWQSVGETFA